MDQTDDRERLDREAFERLASAKEKKPAPVQSEVERAKDLLVELKRKLPADLTAAYAADFLSAAAVFSEQDAQLYHGLRNDLKARGVAVSDWDSRVGQIVRKREAERAAASKAAKSASATKRQLSGNSLSMEDIEPWDQPIDIAELLNCIVALYKRFLVLPPYAAEAMALYVIHTHALEAADSAPRLAFMSPEMRCGKSTAIRITGRIAYRPIAAANISAAAIYRTIDAVAPTLMLDELDRFLGRGNANPGAEEIIGILNAGHTRDEAFVIRTAGDDHEPRKFSTFASVVFASIRKLPQTWADRAIIIPMRRRRRDEKVGRFNRKAKADPIFHELARKCSRWVVDNLDALKAAEPMMPPELDDRAVDNWHPLISIADRAGTIWSLKVRQAALQLSGAKVRQDEDSRGVQLLGDLRDLFSNLGRDKVGSEEVCEYLVGLEERPWAEWGKTRKPITKNQLASMLKPYEIYPKSVALPGGDIPRGYDLKDCIESFERYLSPVFSDETPENALQSANTPNPNGVNDLEHSSRVPTEPSLGTPKNSTSPYGQNEFGTLARENAENGDTQKKEGTGEPSSAADGDDEEAF